MCKYHVTGTLEVVSGLLLDHRIPQRNRGLRLMRLVAHAIRVLTKRIGSPLTKTPGSIPRRSHVGMFTSACSPLRSSYCVPWATSRPKGFPSVRRNPLPFASTQTANNPRESS